MELKHPQILANAVGKYFRDVGFVNYAGEVYTLIVDDTDQQFEIVVTTQLVGAKTPHDLHVEANAKLERATQLLRDIEARLQSGDTDFPSLGYEIECRMQDLLHGQPEPTKSPEMPAARYKALQNGEVKLTQEEKDAGWFFDDEYDGLLANRAWEGHEGGFND